jgi:nitrogen regulatory protein PII
MKKIEIIVPDRLFNDVNRIIRDTHAGGITFQRVEGRGKIKESQLPLLEELDNTLQNLYLG